MERYVELSIADVCQCILTNDLSDLYFKTSNKELRSHS